MINPKPKTGPVVGSVYPTKPGEPTRRALNDAERQEASIISQTAWMNDPLGVKNCHVLDVIDDDISPHGISIDPKRVFDDEVQWKYLEGLLQNKVDQDIASKIKLAHSRLPELFR